MISSSSVGQFGIDCPGSSFRIDMVQILLILCNGENLSGGRPGIKLDTSHSVLVGLDVDIDIVVKLGAFQIDDISAE